MREIKFRAWDGEVMQTVGEMSFMVGGIKIYGLGSHIGNDKYFVDGVHIHLMQFTGLKDKNGRDIYEGDILQFYRQYTSESEMLPIIERVKFDEGRFHPPPWDPQEYPEDAEVIGNLYENPELCANKS